MTGKPLQIGGKIFWFNIQTSRNGTQYLSIVGKHKGSDEKLTMFPAQIPSFIHMVRESYGEMIKELGMEALEVTGEIEVKEKGPMTRWVEAEILKDEKKHKNDLLKACPECGLDGSEELKPDISLKNGGSMVSVNCVDGCGYKWPEKAEWGSMVEAKEIWDSKWLIDVFKRFR